MGKENSYAAIRNQMIKHNLKKKTDVPNVVNKKPTKFATISQTLYKNCSLEVFLKTNKIRLNTKSKAETLEKALMQ